MLEPNVPNNAKSTVKTAAACTAGAGLSAMVATNVRGIRTLNRKRRRRRRAVSHSVLNTAPVTCPPFPCAGPGR